MYHQTEERLSVQLISASGVGAGTIQKQRLRSFAVEVYIQNQDKRIQQKNNYCFDNTSNGQVDTFGITI